MVILYLPGDSRSAGKLYWPLSFVTTVMAMVEPSFLAVTSTPSMLPSSVEDTVPVSAAADCACAPVTSPACISMAAALTLASRQRCRSRIWFSPIIGSVVAPTASNRDWVVPNGSPPGSDSYRSIERGLDDGLRPDRSPAAVSGL